MRNGRTGGHNIVPDRTFQLALGRDEAAAGGVPCAVCENVPGAAKRAQTHPVRVQLGQHFVGKADVAYRIKRYAATAGQRQHPARFQCSDPVVRILRIERFGIKPQEAQHHGLRRRMPCPRQRQRALQLDINPLNSAEGAQLLKFLQEPPRNPDRADRVGARWADAYPE